jgi:curved DNA-binding protein CbpA
MERFAMTDPYAVFGLPPNSDDETIRRRYLELVKQFSPERHPEQFAAIRQAYDSLRDLETRLRYRLFEAGKRESVDTILEDLSGRISRRRLSLQSLVNLVQKP